MQAASVLPLTTMGVESGMPRRNATKGVDVSGLWISKERDHAPLRLELCSQAVPSMKPRHWINPTPGSSPPPRPGAS